MYLYYELKKLDTIGGVQNNWQVGARVEVIEELISNDKSKTRLKKEFQGTIAQQNQSWRHLT